MGNLETRTDQQINSDMNRKGLPSESFETLLLKTVITTAVSIDVSLSDPRLLQVVGSFVTENIPSGKVPKVTMHLPALLAGRIRRIKTG